MRFPTCQALVALAAAPAVLAVTVDWTSDTSIKSGAAQIAYGMMEWYTGNHTGDVPGNLPDPYYWWEAGAMFGTLIDYWAYTGDTTYNDETYQAMQHQIGTNKDFMPDNQTLTEGNDDQGFWAMAALSAAENNFTNPAADSGDAQWLALAQAVFNEYVWRWDNTTCNGGLRWQIYTFNNGYNYKNTISNGCFFNVAARLARYTGNTTYGDWAEKIYNWTADVGFIDADYNVYDGAGNVVTSTDAGNCTAVNKVQWTYNTGIFLYGAAVMYNYTNGSSLWEARTKGLLNTTVSYFFENSVLYEPSCEPQSSCGTDSLSFKAYLVRWLAQTTQMMSSTYETIYPLLLASGKGAALQCAGTTAGSEGATLNGYACGYHWTAGDSVDGVFGVGQQMSGLSAVFYTLVSKAPVPYTSNTGGSSTGDASGGTVTTDSSVTGSDTPITTGDRAGAGILTALVLGSLGGSMWWMIKE